jgi:RimJ/RimL family protein N-acetyltransferase
MAARGERSRQCTSAVEARCATPRSTEPLVIALRPSVAGDYERLVRWIDSPEVLAHWSGSNFSYPLDEQQLEKHFEDNPTSADRRLAFTAVKEEGGDPVGYGELGRIMRTDRSAALSRVLVRQDLRRRGVGTGIVEALCERAFKELGLHRLEVRAFVQNTVAIEVYRRCGFVPEGVLREAARKADRHEDLLVLSMLEDEWRTRRRTVAP